MLTVGLACVIVIHTSRASLQLAHHLRLCIASSDVQKPSSYEYYIIYGMLAASFVAKLKTLVSVPLLLNVKSMPVS